MAPIASMISLLLKVTFLTETKLSGPELITTKINDKLIKNS